MHQILNQLKAEINCQICIGGQICTKFCPNLDQNEQGVWIQCDQIIVLMNILAVAIMNISLVAINKLSKISIQQRLVWKMKTCEWTCLYKVGCNKKLTRGSGYGLVGGAFTSDTISLHREHSVTSKGEISLYG